MKILDILAGRTKPAQADLDALFGLSGAFITLEASESLVPSGEGGVCYKPAAGQVFAHTAEEMESLLGLGGGPTKVREETDQYGFHWVVLGQSAGGAASSGGAMSSDRSAGLGDVDGAGSAAGDDPQALVNQVHLVNSTLQEQGFGPQLLCSVFGFRPAGGAAPAGAGARATAYIVYLYKRGTFYPFVPLAGREQRDVETELRLSIVLADDLKVEKDKANWMALWGLPVH
ncbi:MAG: PspA-associated protein PspAB [Acidimicrobiales bacterium]